MRERTTWNRNTIASALKKIAEDPRAMNQDHLQQQPAADAYLIGDGSPSEFAEDVHSEAKNWKAEYGADGQTSRNEIGMPNMRGDTFTNSEKSPGESPKRASFDVEAINKRAELTTDIARLMCKGASESVIEDQAFDLMDLPMSSLKAMYQRLAAQQGDEDEDEGQDKEASDDEDEDDVKAQQQQQAAKKAKKSQQQVEGDDDEDDVKAQQQQQAAKKAGQQQQGQKQQAQDQDKEGQDQEQSKEAKKGGDVPPQFLEQQQKMKDKAKDKDDEGDDDKGQDKEAASMAKSAAASLLAFPEGVSRNEAAKVLLLPIYKHLAAKQGCQDAMAQQQLLGQVQQMVQQAMQQQQQAQQQQQGQQQEQMAQQMVQQGQQQMLSDEELVDQMLMDQGQGQDGQMFLAEGDIEMEVPNMDVGDVVLTAQDQELLGQVFASTELSDAMEAAALQGHHTASAPHSFQPQAQVRTASTRTVGTRPTAGVATLGGASNGGGSSGSDEINTLTSLWNSAPDVSQAF